MREWRVMLRPFLIWALHFVVIYGVASVADISSPDVASTWRVAGFAATATAIIALVASLFWSLRRQRVSSLASKLAVAGFATSLLAVGWQSLPLLLSALPHQG